MTNDPNNYVCGFPDNKAPGGGNPFAVAPDTTPGPKSSIEILPPVGVGTPARDANAEIAQLNQKLFERYLNGDVALSTKAPEREFLLKDVITMKQVTGLYGDGGIGKSLVALQLAVAVASGTLWLGREVRRGPVVYLAAEEDRDEAHRRARDIARDLNADLKDLHIFPVSDMDATLAAPGMQRGTVEETPLYTVIEQICAYYQPTLIVMDTLANLYGGDEVDRRQVVQFVTLMRRLAIDNESALLLLA